MLLSLKQTDSALTIQLQLHTTDLPTSSNKQSTTENNECSSERSNHSQEDFLSLSTLLHNHNPTPARTEDTNNLRSDCAHKSISAFSLSTTLPSAPCLRTSDSPVASRFSNNFICGNLAQSAAFYAEPAVPAHATRLAATNQTSRREERHRSRDVTTARRQGRQDLRRFTADALHAPSLLQSRGAGGTRDRDRDAARDANCTNSASAGVLLHTSVHLRVLDVLSTSW